jgi:hypothetical protein
VSQDAGVLVFGEQVGFEPRLAIFCDAANGLICPTQALLGPPPEETHAYRNDPHHGAALGFVQQ